MLRKPLRASVSTAIGVILALGSAIGFGGCGGGTESAPPTSQAPAASPAKSATSSAGQKQTASASAPTLGKPRSDLTSIDLCTLLSASEAASIAGQALVQNPVPSGCGYGDGQPGGVPTHVVSFMILAGGPAKGNPDDAYKQYVAYAEKQIKGLGDAAIIAHSSSDVVKVSSVTWKQPGLVVQVIVSGPSDADGSANDAAATALAKKLSRRLES